MLTEIAIYFSGFEANFLLSKLKAAQVICEEAVDLIFEIGRHAIKGSDYIPTSTQLLWEIANSELEANKKHQEKATAKFAESFNSIESNEIKESYITKCIEKIKVNSLLGYKILKKILG